MKVNVGDIIVILQMNGEPNYEGKIGRIEAIDDMGQIHGTWGGLAIIPSEDKFQVIQKAKVDK